MKFKNPLLAVTDLERSKEFYRQTLGLRVVADFGANVTLTGGVCLQTKETWVEFIHKEPEEICFYSHAGELYFEEDNFDGFLEKLNSMPEIKFVHRVFQHRWGQRCVRFYDPDGHILEVGETMKIVCRRFLDSGMTLEETALRMDIPLKNARLLAK